MLLHIEKTKLQNPATGTGRNSNEARSYNIAIFLQNLPSSLQWQQVGTRTMPKIFKAKNLLFPSTSNVHYIHLSITDYVRFSVCHIDKINLIHSPSESSSNFIPTSHSREEKGKKKEHRENANKFKTRKFRNFQSRSNLQKS